MTFRSRIYSIERTVKGHTFLGLEFISFNESTDSILATRDKDLITFRPCRGKIYKCRLGQHFMICFEHLAGDLHFRLLLWFELFLYAGCCNGSRCDCECIIKYSCLHKLTIQKHLRF